LTLRLIEQILANRADSSGAAPVEPIKVEVGTTSHR
jgi:hypothetical protein